ncbi:hypothetical protein FA10DRAFT_264936 [Acaromyces ingoldii]|uniref:Myb-like domain-containing protein n=1 Tax=Acaromyces ingoldii TaxID=215250 RepID=A0A316YYX8_9BASI|nr:hypothetical protein FA10DRAFT_264936 [Acaromyces ingoldii]PWN94401.1 hypothetical protein FA10DRAFT_264936 [Acaromyces ingoldii]
MEAQAATTQKMRKKGSLESMASGLTVGMAMEKSTNDAEPSKKKKKRKDKNKQDGELSFTTDRDSDRGARHIVWDNAGNEAVQDNSPESSRSAIPSAFGQARDDDGVEEKRQKRLEKKRRKEQKRQEREMAAQADSASVYEPLTAAQASGDADSQRSGATTQGAQAVEQGPSSIPGPSQTSRESPKKKKKKPKINHAEDGSLYRSNGLGQAHLSSQQDPAIEDDELAEDELSHPQSETVRSFSHAPERSTTRQAEPLSTSPSKPKEKRKSKKGSQVEVGSDHASQEGASSAAVTAVNAGASPQKLSVSSHQGIDKGKKRAAEPEDVDGIDSWQNAENSSRKRGRKKRAADEGHGEAAPAQIVLGQTTSNTDPTLEEHEINETEEEPISSKGRSRKSVVPSLAALTQIAQSNPSGSSVGRKTTRRGPRNETNALHSKEATIADAYGLRHEDILVEKLYQPHQLRWLAEGIGLEYKLGAFSKTEDEHIENALLEFGEEHGLNRDQTIDLMFNAEATKSELFGSLFRAATRSVPGRSNRHVRKHLQTIYHPLAHAGPWTQEQTEALQQAVASHGQDWVAVAKVVGRRRDDCRVRWRDQLTLKTTRPDSAVVKNKGTWTEAEMEKLRNVIEEVCRELSIDIEKRESIPWTTVSARLGGERNANQIYQKWCVMLDKGLWNESDDFMLLQRMSEQTEAVENDDITMIVLRDLQTDQWRFSPKTMRRNWQKLVKKFLDVDNYKTNFAANLAKLNGLRHLSAEERNKRALRSSPGRGVGSGRGKSRKGTTKGLDKKGVDTIDSDEEV